MIIGTNFKLSSAKFLDDRQLCKDYATLIANTEGIIYPPGFEVFCEYENKYYQYVSDSKGGYIWEERKSGVSDGTIGASIKDDTISENYTWSSAHIDSMRIDLETLITQANDYVDEIDERMLFIEGKFQWFEYFDGSYESLSNKPTIPTKISELENDSEFLGIERLELELENINEKIDAKIDKEEDRTLISVAELERLSAVDNYNDTEVRQLIDELETQAHTHINSDILNTITEEKINQWDNNTGVDDYNYIQNKPIIRVGDDSDILLNFSQIIDEGMYIITAMVGEYKVHNELVHVKWTDDDNVKLTIPNMFMVLDINRTDGVWTIVNELHYGVDRENGKISDTLTIGEDKIILDKEGNGWFGGKVSQEGIPTEDKDLVTKGYMDEKFTNYATNERIDTIDKENARRDVIIEALVNGRRRTVETDGNDVDLMFSTEKDKVWIDKIEGETLVNVCDQEEPIAITKSYTVEGTNHVPLQGEYDGKARPVVHGNTLVNHNIEYDRSLVAGKKVEREGTKILNLEGTVNSELAVKLEGHTAINLSTKKEDILCKSFDSASGNEINLVAEENSVSDLVIQGNTMVNLVQKKGASDDALFAFSGSRTTFKRTLEGNYCVYESILTEGNNTGYISINTGSHSLLKSNTKYTIMFTIKENTRDIRGVAVRAAADPFYASNGLYFNSTYALTTGVHMITITTDSDISSYTGLGFSFTPVNNIAGYFRFTIGEIMIFEGDLTQTPELIPTEYVEGLQSTFEDKLIPYSIYNGDNLTSITETQYQLPLTVKPNTQYTVTTTVNTTKYQYAVYSTDGLTEYLSYNTTTATQTFTCNTNNVLFKVRMNPSYEGEDYSFVLDEVKDKFLIVEGDWNGRLDLLTEEYFGKYRVDMSSHGKNLFDKNNINELQYMCPDGNYGHIVSDPYESIYWIKIKPSTTYTISKMASYRGRVAFSKELPNLSTEIRVVTTGECPSYPISATSLSDENYLLINGYSLTLRPQGTPNYGETITKEELLNSIQIEEGTQATPYEPYYGSSKTVYLNSPLLNGDELLTKDGKLYHYHKMGRVVLDGSENWVMEIGENVVQVNHIKIWSDIIKSPGIIASDKFKLISQEDYMSQEIEGVRMGVADRTCELAISISKSKLSTTDVNGFKQWLSENPTTVVYQLAEPWYEPIGAYEKIMLDGSEDEPWDLSANSDGATYRNGLLLPSDKLGVEYAYSSDKITIYCDKLPAVSFEDAYGRGAHGIGLWGPETYAATYLFISKGFKTIGEARTWLKQNPITVIYELANPQYVDEDTRFNIASTSTIEYQSNVPMANTQFLPYRNELPLLESSTQYRVKFDCDVEGLELMVSLGGTTQTITSKLHNDLSFITPSLQTDGKLTIDGYGIAKIDNVLVTKGDMEYEYFEGLKSGFEDGYIPQSIIDLTNVTISDGAAINLPVTNIKPNTKYTIIDETLKGKYMAIRFKDNNKDTSTDSSILSDTILDYVPFSGLYVITTYNETYDFSNVVLRMYNNFGMNNTTIDFSNMIILEGDWSENLSDIINNLNKYKANIRIKNPNAPIFGKGGRL